MADTLYSCQAPSGTGTDTYTLTLPAGPNVLVFQTTDANQVALPITVTAPDSTTVSCQQSPVDECATSQQGTYTVAVTSDSISYTLEFTALLSAATCPTISLSLAGSAVTGTLTAGQPGACYSLGTSGPPAGHILHAYMGIYAEQIETIVFDSAGNLVCAQVDGNCTLTGTGPYRVLATDFGQAENPYEFQVADVTDPAGCVPVAQQVFGTVPALGTDLCSSLTVTTSGNYQIYSVDKGSATQNATLYTPSGGNACTGGGPFCQLAPGSYNLVLNYLLEGDQVSTVFIAAAESQGCVAASDTTFASGDATGTFAGPGEELCRTLPTPAGLSDYLYSQPVTSGSRGQILEIVDSAGTQMCPGAFTYSSFGTCALTGTAPFRVILVTSGPDSHFRLLVQRTDSTAGCASWPRSGYGNAAGAHVTLTNADNAKCFVVPPAGRSAAELVEDADSTDGAAALLTLDDPSGKTLCSGNGYPTDWTVCDYKAGVTYTALLVNLAFPAITGDMYSLVRRDITGQAACSSPVSTSPGGPTTSFTLGSSVAARCFRVSSVKADKFMFALRDSAPYDSSAFNVPSATIIIANSSGTLQCTWGLFCPVGGSAGYQAIVLTVDYTDVAITVHLDSWRVGTSAGWAAACQRHHFSTGATSAAVSDTLTDSADVYCGVIDMAPNQFWSIYGSSTAIYPSSVYMNAYPAGSWATPFQTGGICGIGGAVLCQLELAPGAQPTQALLIVAPFGASQDPISFDMQGVCTLGCTVQRPASVYTSITPAAQRAGPDNTVVLSGTGLNFASPFNLMAQNGSAYTPSVPVSVNAAGTRLTLRLDTTQVPPGTYDIAAGDFCSPAPCSDWLLNAYKVTRAPAPPPATRFVPLTPARVLDTQTGLAAKRARVPAHATVTFPVTGHAGVPTSRVAAVILDVSAVAPSSAGYLTVFAAGRARPPAQMAEFTAGRSVTGLVSVPVVNGRVAVYNGSPGPVDLTADVLGYDTTATAGLLFTPVGPVRILTPAGVAARHALTLSVAGAGGVPAHGAGAVALDVTVTGPAKAGRLIAYADGTRGPVVTSLSFAAGQRVTELVIARMTDGKVDLYNASGGPLTVTADAFGYYSAAGSVFHPVNALRVMDTKTGFGGAGEAILPQAAAKLSALWNTMPQPASVVTAVVLNVTVLGGRSAGALEVFADGPLYEDGVTLPNSTSLPGTPNLAFLPGQAQSNLVIVPTGNLTDFYDGSAGNLQVVADLVGYYTS
jgi:hypothetical protein